MRKQPVLLSQAPFQYGDDKNIKDHILVQHQHADAGIRRHDDNGAHGKRHRRREKQIQGRSRRTLPQPFFYKPGDHEACRKQAADHIQSPGKCRHKGVRLQDKILRHITVRPQDEPGKPCRIDLPHLVQAVIGIQLRKDQPCGQAVDGHGCQKHQEGLHPGKENRPYSLRRDPVHTPFLFRGPCRLRPVFPQKIQKQAADQHRQRQAQIGLVQPQAQHQKHGSRKESGPVSADQESRRTGKKDPHRIAVRREHEGKHAADRGKGQHQQRNQHHAGHAADIQGRNHHTGRKGQEKYRKQPADPGDAPDSVQRIDIFQEPSAEFRSHAKASDIVDVVPVGQLVREHIGMDQDAGYHARAETQADAGGYFFNKRFYHIRILRHSVHPFFAVPTMIPST